MAYISVQEGLHGIRGLLAFRPETAKGIGLLTQELLQTDTGISKGEREIIAAYVSTLNNCFYCATSHAAIAKYHCNEDEAFVQKAINDPQNSDLSPKMKALMEIAKQVQQHGQNVKQHHIDTARSAGATACAGALVTIIRWMGDLLRMCVLSTTDGGPAAALALGACTRTCSTTAPCGSF